MTKEFIADPTIFDVLKAVQDIFARVDNLESRFGERFDTLEYHQDQHKAEIRTLHREVAKTNTRVGMLESATFGTLDPE